MARLYPPQINGSLPAFYKEYNLATNDVLNAFITIPYTMNLGVGYAQIDGFCLRIKNISSGTYVCPPQYSSRYDAELSEVIFEIPKIYAEVFEEGQFYKVQLSYYKILTSQIEVGNTEIIVDKTDPNAIKEIGYFSTVGTIKCVSKPTVSISGYSIDSTNLFTGAFLGVYDLKNGIDKTEKVYSYTFNIYNKDDELYYTTGELLHNSVNDVEYGMSTDQLIINDFISSSNEVFKIEYIVKTLNGLTLSSPLYRMTAEQLLTASKEIEIMPTPNPDEAYITINFKGVEGKDYNGKPAEEIYYGEYILARACEEDGYREWIEMHRFRLQDEKPSSVSFRDFSIKQGVKYKYGISQFNMWGIIGTRQESPEVSVDFEDMFLFDGERQLKIRFNPKMSKFGTTVLEQKVETLGSKFPYIFRNGKVEYKEFPVSGLISYQMDNARLFYHIDYDYIIHRKTSNYKNSIPDDERGFFNHFDLTEENILRERNFKLDVLNWLNNGKPKMFKSATEGNYIVRLLKVSLKPTDKLGRMLHTFSCNAYEIADFTYENLYKYGFVKKSDISRYVSLWKTYNFADWGSGEDIVINFESEVSEFLIQDLRPGTKVELYPAGSIVPTEIMIGATGSYRYIGSSQKISKIIIPVNEGQRLSGTIECQYVGLRYSDFDSIKDVKLKTIVSQQYIGVDPILNRVSKEATSVVDSIEFLNSLKQRILRNKNNINEVKQIIQLGSYGTYKTRFLPGDIIQKIESSIYNFQKPKVKILNIEQAHFRLRDRIPIYKVPYEYLPEEQKINVQNGGYNIQINQDYIKEKNIKRYDAYQTDLPFELFYWFVTPFGKPYPIDRLFQVVKESAVMNDPFCIFELFEYQNGEWVHFSGKNDDSSTHYGGYYYDAYYAEKYPNNYSNCLFYDYDPTFFIQDRINYCPIENEQGGDYPSLNKTIDILQLYPDIYIQESEENYIKYYENGQRTSDQLFAYDCYYYRVQQIDKYIYYKLDKNIVDTYFNNKEFYDNLYWVQDENGNYVQLKDAIISKHQENIYCVEDKNKIDLSYGREMHFENLGSVETLNIGNGVIAELTFQLQIIDYFTEENDKDVAEKKANYLTASNYLKNIFESYENIAKADKEYRQYEALYKAYTKLLQGSTASQVKMSVVEHMIILALLNIENVPRDVLLSLKKCEESIPEWEKIQEQIQILLDQNQSFYNFESLLNIVEPNKSLKRLILNLYNDNQTIKFLSLLDEYEYTNLQDILTPKLIEGIFEKIQKLENIYDEVSASYTKVKTEIAEQENVFNNNKEETLSKVNQYNKLIRQWAMCLFIIETQLHTWQDEEGKSQGPYSLAQIANYYAERDFYLEEEITTGTANVGIWVLKANDILTKMKEVIEHLKTYEKIKADNSEDDLLDNYITEKEYSYIEDIFVFLNSLLLIYEENKKLDVNNTLYSIYYNQAYPTMMNFFMGTESFSNLAKTIEETFNFSLNKYQSLLEQFMAYHPNVANIESLTFEEVEPESKTVLQELIIALDEMDYSSNYYLKAMSNVLTSDLIEKISNARNECLRLKTIAIKLLSLKEQMEVDKERPVINFDATQWEGSLILDNLAIDEEAYFTYGVPWERLFDTENIPADLKGNQDKIKEWKDDINKKKILAQKQERKQRISLLLSLLDNIQNDLSAKTTSAEIIKHIQDNYLKGQNVSNPALLNIILYGYGKNSLFNRIKNFNSFIELKRVNFVSALKKLCENENSLVAFYKESVELQNIFSTVEEFLTVVNLPAAEGSSIDPIQLKTNNFYKEILIDKEFKPALQAWNDYQALNSKTNLIAIQDSLFEDFGKNAKYQNLNTVYFDTDNIFDTIIKEGDKTNVFTKLQEIDNISNLQLSINRDNIIMDISKEEKIKIIFNGDYEILIPEISLIYMNYGLEIYQQNECLNYFVGSTISTQNQTLKTGIFNWFLRLGIYEQLKYYSALLEETMTLLEIYRNRESNYLAKQEKYLNFYQTAKAIYDSYSKTEEMNYYLNEPEEKQQAIIEATQKVETTWNDFIIALDKAYSEEVERGMYI